MEVALLRDPLLLPRLAHSAAYEDGEATDIGCPMIVWIWTRSGPRGPQDLTVLTNPPQSESRLDVGVCADVTPGDAAEVVDGSIGEVLSGFEGS